MMLVRLYTVFSMAITNCALQHCVGDLTKLQSVEGEEIIFGVQCSIFRFHFFILRLKILQKHKLKFQRLRSFSLRSRYFSGHSCYEF